MPVTDAELRELYPDATEDDFAILRCIELARRYPQEFMEFCNNERGLYKPVTQAYLNAIVEAVIIGI